MKLIKSLASVLVLGMAICVTVGSVYMTVQAAAQQADEEATPPPADANPFEEVQDAVENVVDPAEAVVPVGEPAAGAENDGVAAADEPVELAAPEAVAEVQVEEIVLPESRDHFIHLNSQGGFQGQLSSLSNPEGNMNPAVGVQVQVIRSGAVIASAETNEEGTFSVSGLSPGVAVLLARGDNEFMLFSVRLAPPKGGATPVKAELIALEMDSAVLSGRNVEAALELLFGDDGIDAFAFDNDEGPRTVGSYPAESGEKSTELAHHSIQLQADGTLVGDVYVLEPGTGGRRPIKDLRLHFMKNGEIVASTQVAHDGRFSVQGLAAGTYGLVANGEDGIAALGIHLIDAAAAAELQADSKYKTVSIAQQLDLTFSPVDSTFVGSRSQDNNPPATPLALTPPSVTSGGGGGGAGSGSGFGSILAGAAAGAAAAALLDDDAASPGR